MDATPVSQKVTTDCPEVVINPLPSEATEATFRLLLESLAVALEHWATVHVSTATLRKKSGNSAPDCCLWQLKAEVEKEIYFAVKSINKIIFVGL